MKPFVVILGLLSLGLTAQLFIGKYRGQQAQKDLVIASARLQAMSNEVADARSKLNDESQLASYLQSNLLVRVTELATASNSIGSVSTTLSVVQGELTTAQSELQKQSARVSELEGQKDEMQVKLNELAGSIKKLDSQIIETKRKLSSAEGDRASLTRELVRLQSDKADLLHQFNNLAALRAQVALLRDEAAVNQRLAWMAQGVYQSSGRKGAEALVAKPGPNILGSQPVLDVELDQKGGSRLISPSNTPAQK